MGPGRRVMRREWAVGHPGRLGFWVTHVAVPQLLQVLVYLVRDVPLVVLGLDTVSS